MLKEDLILDNIKELSGSVKELNKETKEQSVVLAKIDTTLITHEKRISSLEGINTWAKRLILSIPISAIIAVLAILIKGCAF